jgi:hypothetical protein
MGKDRCPHCGEKHIGFNRKALVLAGIFLAVMLALVLLAVMRPGITAAPERPTAAVRG